MTVSEILEHFSYNAFVKLCGIKLVPDEESGEISCVVDVEPKHLNGNFHLHGGFLYTLADTAAGANARRYWDKVTTLDSNFHFLRSHETTRLVATCELLRNGGRVLVLRVNIKGDGGEVFSEGTFTFYKLIKERDAN